MKDRPLFNLRLAYERLIDEEEKSTLAMVRILEAIQAEEDGRELTDEELSEAALADESKWKELVQEDLKEEYFMEPERFTLKLECCDLLNELETNIGVEKAEILVNEFGMQLYSLVQNLVSKSEVVGFDVLAKSIFIKLKTYPQFGNMDTNTWNLVINYYRLLTILEDYDSSLL